MSERRKRSVLGICTQTHACARLQHHLSHCDPRHMPIAFAAIVIHTSQSHLDNLSHSNHVALRPGGKPGQKNPKNIIAHLLWPPRAGVAVSALLALRRR